VIDKPVSDVRLKRAILYYMMAGLVFVMVASSIILGIKYRDSLAETVNTLRNARLNLIQVRDTSHAVESSLSGIKAVLPPRVLSRLPEEVLLEGIDDFKEKMKGNEITVPNSNMVRQGDEISLPVQIKLGSGDYTDLVNTIGYLQSLQFPFFGITNISLSKGPDKVLCEIRGSLHMPKK